MIHFHFSALPCDIFIRGEIRNQRRNQKSEEKWNQMRIHLHFQSEDKKNSRRNQKKNQNSSQISKIIGKKIRWGVTCTSSLRRSKQSCAVPHPWFNLHHHLFFKSMFTRRSKKSVCYTKPPYIKLPALGGASMTVIEAGTVFRGKPENTLSALSRAPHPVSSMHSSRHPCYDFILTSSKWAADW